MKKHNIFVYSTAVGETRGGISSALVAFRQSMAAENISFVPTHGKPLAFWAACKHIHTKVNRDDICWFHCGRWLSILRKLLLARFAKLYGGKVVLHLHSQAVSGYADHPVGRVMMQLVLSTSDKVFVVSPWWKNYLSKAFPDFADRMEVCVNPLSSDLVTAAKQFSERLIVESQSCIRLLTLTRLVSGKGVEGVIDAMKLLPPNYHLSIAGDGILRQKLQDKVMALGLESRVLFCGWVEGEDKADLYRDSDIFVLPSRFDSFGMGYVEAMSYGLPCVALKYQAIPDVVSEGHGGVLLDDDSPQALSEGIKLATAKTRGCNRNPQEYVLDKFHPDTVTARLLQIFEEL